CQASPVQAANLRAVDLLSREACFKPRHLVRDILGERVRETPHKAAGCHRRRQIGRQAHFPP
ncbi:MAG: hypothetical protein VW949_08310, partial [Paracoccaceae bacterium]